MGLRQDFCFVFESQDSVRQLLRTLSSSAPLTERNKNFFVFTQKPGDPAFTFDCELTTEGLRINRAGAYFAFLGLFLEALTGHFGKVTTEDI